MLFIPILLSIIISLVYSHEVPVKVELNCNLNQKVTFGYTLSMPSHTETLTETGSFTLKGEINTVYKHVDPSVPVLEELNLKLTHDCSSNLEEQVAEFKITTVGDQFVKSIDLSPK